MARRGRLAPISDEPTRRWRRSLQGGCRSRQLMDAPKTWVPAGYLFGADGDPGVGGRCAHLIRARALTGSSPGRRTIMVSWYSVQLAGSGMVLLADDAMGRGSGGASPLAPFAV